MAYINIDISLDEFNDQELIEALRSRGYLVGDAVQELAQGFERLIDCRRYQPEQFDRMFADLAYQHNGKIL